MKAALLFFTLAFPLTAPLWSQMPAEPPLTTVTFSETVFDFGVVEQGTAITHRFIVTNAGNQDLITEAIKRSCPCNPIEWSKEPIKPGESGFVEVTIHPRNAGEVNKSILFTANIPVPVGLFIKGEVKKKEELNLHGGSMMDAQPVLTGEPSK